MSDHFRDPNAPHRHVEIDVKPAEGDRYKTQCKMIADQLIIVNNICASCSTAQITATDAEVLAIIVNGEPIKQPIHKIGYCLDNIKTAKQAVLDLHELLCEVEADAEKAWSSQ